MKIIQPKKPKKLDIFLFILKHLFTLSALHANFYRIPNAKRKTATVKGENQKRSFVPTFSGKTHEWT